MLKRIINKIMVTLITDSQNANYLRKCGYTIGEGSYIYKNAYIGSEPSLVKIGRNVRVTNGVYFITHDGGLWTLRKMGLIENLEKFGKIEIGDNTHIGINSIIMPNVRIGKNCIIGCSAVVTKDIPDNSVAAGVPAKVIESIKEYYKKNSSLLHETKNMTDCDKESYIRNKLSKVDNE